MKRSIINLDHVVYEPKKKLSVQIKMALEVQDTYQASVQDLNDSDQALEIARSLEDLHIVLKDIENKTPTEIALIKNMANAAVAGKDVDSSKVIPSLEDIAEKQTMVTSLLERIGLILNSYVHSVTQSFELLINHLGSVLHLIRENICIIEDLRKKFAVPDDHQDDIERSVKFDDEDKPFMVTPIGLATTFGDLFNSFKNSRKSFKELTDVSMIVNSRLLDCIRQIIPSTSIDTPDKLVGQVNNANSSLFDNINQMWETSIGKSNLTSARSDDGCETFETVALLGGSKLCFGIKRLNTPSDQNVSFDKRSEIIRSFNLNRTQLSASQDSGDFMLTGITNKGINLFIEEIKKFVVDLERYVSWCTTTAEMAKSQSANDIANVNKFYTTSISTSMSATESEQMRQTFQNHVIDISAMVKIMAAIATLPTQYANDILNGLVIIVCKMPQETPVGSYNALK